MIELLKVELTNFRSFAKGSFTPLGIGQGLTAINGANGMGKSSIVHAVVWALYGITPDGVRVGALRRQGSEGSGDVEVKVELQFNGQTITVVRGLRGKNDTTIASIELDGVEQTNVSSRTASQWITNYIGLDAEAFLTAFVVRQKELDSLVRARPAERRKTIERLAGIERMSKALELARQSSREAQRVVDAMPAAQDPTLIEQEIAEVETALLDAVAALDAAKESLDKKTSTQTEIAEEIKEARAGENQRRQTLQDTQILESRISDLRERAQVLSEKSQESAKLEEYSQDIKAATEAFDLAEETWSAYQELKQSEALSKSQVRSSKSVVDKLKKELAEVESERVLAEQILNGLEVISSKEIKDLENSLEKATEELGSDKANLTRMKKALEAIDEHMLDGEHASCPTCEQEIKDPTAIHLALTSGVEDYTSRVQEKEAEIKATRFALDSANQSRKTYEASSQALETLKNQEASVIDELTVAESACKEAEDELKTISENLESLGSEESIREARKLAESEKSIASENLRKAEAAQEAADELDTVEAALEKREEELKALKVILAGLSSESHDLESLQEQLDALAIEILSASQLQQENGYAVIALQDKESQLRATLAEALRVSQQRKEALRDAEIKAAAAQSLADFRTDRLARLTPELSEVATDFVSRMTDGKYTSVILDDEFTPVLTDAAGNERPVAWLSGGEESAVALALRVAIGEVLAGQRGGLLVLDEVLTAQDASRRQATMSAIKALPRQIITINHVSEATDMVDLVANIVDDGEGASTIEEWAPDILGGKIDSLEYAEAE